MNIKKGQFLAPHDMKNVHRQGRAPPPLRRAAAGTTSWPASDGSDWLQQPGADMTQPGHHAREQARPWCYDATHGVQLPGGQGTGSGGMREMVPCSRAPPYHERRSWPACSWKPPGSAQRPVRQAPMPCRSSTRTARTLLAAWTQLVANRKTSLPTDLGLNHVSLHAGRMPDQGCAPGLTTNPLKPKNGILLSLTSSRPRSAGQPQQPRRRMRHCCREIGRRGPRRRTRRASTRFRRSIELRDSDGSRYLSKGVLQGGRSTSTPDQRGRASLDSLKQEDRQDPVIGLDGTDNKGPPWAPTPCWRSPWPWPARRRWKKPTCRCTATSAA